MKEQQKRKIQQFHPEIDDGIDLRRCPQGLPLGWKEQIRQIGKILKQISNSGLRYSGVVPLSSNATKKDDHSIAE